ncbi:hypothetical protein Syun_021579 [Stephania yunnanensis]|uniref:Uncharacterized protein n=1 Tax=Stephania yunnanensis TaxID=152371 RepID=A0AAP0IHT5_9MAGN
MALATPLLQPFSPPQPNPNPNSFSHIRRRICCTRALSKIATRSEGATDPKLVTFLGKGGSGKTTSSILAAKYFADSGLNTCLVIHSQDPTAEYLMGCKIGTSPTICGNNLSAVRLETTKMLLEPLNQLKVADVRLKLTQGVLEGVVGEELGVLPGMDSIFTALALEKLLGFFRTSNAIRSKRKGNFDVVIYDGISNEETLRMIGATRRAKWYLKYLRNIAEKTELGRLSTPSLLRLADEVMRSNGIDLQLDGKLSAEIWDVVERLLERASTSFTEPSRFGCYLAMDPKCAISVTSALRYWGCAIQSGAHISGAIGFAPPQSCEESAEVMKKNFSPLPKALMPYLAMGSPVALDAVTLGEDIRHLFASGSNHPASVRFDPSKKSVTLFMPGFDKTEIKLYQYRGGSELLVEAGDQRRVIHLPSEIQGKVGGAKFTDRNLVITMR